MHSFFSRWAGKAYPASAARIATALLATACLMPPAPVQAQASERARQKEEAESERSALLEKLDALKRAIGRTEAARSDAADALAKTEGAISDAKRSLRDLAQQQQDARQRLAQLSARQEAIEGTIARQQKELGRLLRRQYVDGREDRLKLVLSGDNPNRIGRDLQYLGYLSQAQAALVEALRSNLETVESHRAETLAAKQELDEMAEQERSQKAALDREKAQHAALLAQLSDKLRSQRREAGQIERDEQRLSGLVIRLQKLIEDQQREEAARRRREAQQRELAARQKAERERAAKERERSRQAEAARSGTRPPAARATHPDAIDDDEPPTATAGTGAPGPAGEQPAGASDDTRFASLRGRLKLPVQGELTARFGSRRTEGPPWKGWFIRAAEGSDVRSVAVGQVVFADWLRGFGNLIIIDHGGQYMTIYGNNQAVLKRVGDRVGAGDVIASVGSSGGNEQSGLYFEMRHRGRALDPLGWITVR